MNISFDLDSTLIPNGDEFETEKRNRIAKFIGIEKLRKDARELIAEIQKQGHVVHIYTTSFRKKNYIRLNLKYYGIKVDRIVNQTENQRILKNRKIYSSKYPTAFYFDLHIDNSTGVRIEGEKYNFSTIIIEPYDKNWKDKILDEIKAFGNKS